ncbi:MAG: hypothetical protein IH850_08925 [Acidobacteria bacterium]|nr:hypothetical protein [Acidobacteriota bacterium]
MSDSSDYQGEMFIPLSISDTDAEALMTGADGIRSDLGDLADVLGAIETAGQAFVDMDISRMARAAALEARAVPAARLDAAQSAARSEWMARMAPRVAVGALALIMLVVSSTGLAFAANGAKPGDMLYGLDRAAEVLGIGDGGSNERIAEAHALVASGAVAVGLTHAAAVLPATPDNEMARAAIQKAATRVQGEPQGPSSSVAEQVGTLLSYLRLATAAGTVNTSTLALPDESLRADAHVDQLLHGHSWAWMENFGDESRGTLDVDLMRGVWQELGPQLLADWIADHPATRPWA